MRLAGGGRRDGVELCGEEDVSKRNVKERGRLMCERKRQAEEREYKAWGPPRSEAWPAPESDGRRRTRLGAGSIATRRATARASNDR